MANLIHIIANELWQDSTTRLGKPFSSLPQWVAYPQPHGLGVCDERTAKFLRRLLIDGDRLGIWATVLCYICTTPGHPKTLVDDDDFQPFYRVSTASNAIDRRLLRLANKEPNLFKSLVNGTLTLPAAEARTAWKRRAVPTRQSAVFSMEKLTDAFKQLDDRAQVEMLDMLWECTVPNARILFMSMHETGGS